MKEEINNEMDALLRSLSRRDGESRLNDENSSASDHLDVDELNAYAENALPEKSRLRYTEHLAECTRCRGLVTQLSQSSGLELPRTEKPQSSWVATLLAKFLSPFTLRFALPTLAAIGLVAIGLIVLRREPEARLTADMKQQQVVEKSHSNSGFQDGSVSSESPSQPTIQQGKVAVRPTELNAQNKATDSIETPQSKAAPSEAQSKDQPAVFGSLAGAAPAPTVAQPQEVAKVDDLERRQIEDMKKLKEGEETRDKEAAAKEPEAARGRRADEQKASAPAARTGSVSDAYQIRPGVATASSERKREGDADGNEASKNESETKTVAGRQFRKRGNLWMDTAYNSSMSTLTLNRGSESYRSLVADEPAIRTIADSLDGEVIIVWKGKAYRIR
jgi:hypothetical protein